MILRVPKHLSTALAELGVKEIPGPGSNPRIEQYLKTVGIFDGDHIPWCSAFVNWVMEQAGIQGTGLANARSWLNWGVQIDEPHYGCVVVLWRIDPTSASGHVGFYMGHQPDSGRIYLLGGNQSDMVTVAPYDGNRLLSYRWLRRLPKGAIA